MVFHSVLGQQMVPTYQLKSPKTTRAIISTEKDILHYRFTCDTGILMWYANGLEAFMMLESLEILILMLNFEMGQFPLVIELQQKERKQFLHAYQVIQHIPHFRFFSRNLLIEAAHLVNSFLDIVMFYILFCIETYKHEHNMNLVQLFTVSLSFARAHVPFVLAPPCLCIQRSSVTTDINCLLQGWSQNVLSVD